MTTTKARLNLRSALVPSVAIALLLGFGMTGCKRKVKEHKTVIQNTGSDTLVNVAQAWAEEYAKVNPSVSVEVSGGGSGTGIAALINGTVDIANCSRKFEPQEIQKAKTNTGKDPVEFMVGYDAMAVFVHKDNPLKSITLEELASIYGEGGAVTTWAQLGVKMPAGSDEIIRISRQSNSGTYHYFREAVLGKGKDFKLGSRDMHGSKDVVELVSKTPGAIGYSGMGYAMPGTRMVPVAKKTGDAAIEPTLANAMSGAYPIARPLFMYTLGQPTGAVKAYMDWVVSAPGQVVVVNSGYVPLPQFAPKAH